MFQLDETHELYAHMNINYIRLEALPPFDRWGEALTPLANGAFFTTTGEVLLSNVDWSESTDTELTVTGQLDWTFPLRFAKVVWGDGPETHRELFPMTQTPSFGTMPFEFTVDATGWDWARIAVWDVAANGAFVNPTWRD